MTDQTRTPVFGCDITLDRRRLLLAGGASLAMWAFRPYGAHAAARDPRLLVVVLRGGMDGLALLAPTGDPDYARLREGFSAAAASKGGGSTTPLGNFFTLNRNLPFLAELYGRRQAIIAHAVASPYRGRSHFDGQDVLESGLGGVGGVRTGWLNRALAGLPAAGAVDRKGLSIGPVVPLLMRGPAPVLTWVPNVYETALHDSTVARLRHLYAHTDPKLLAAITDGLASAAIGGAGSGDDNSDSAMSGGASARGRGARDFIATAEVAARFLTRNDGPRLGVLSYNGWDTHANQGSVDGQLGRQFQSLDGALKALHDGLGAAWKETVVVVVTEFGRTVRANGTNGTDHGTATTALLLGGAVKGGRIIADWPGLKPAQLYEGRDLAPTLDLRALLKGVLQDHIGIPTGALASTVFPDSAAVAPLRDLIG